MRWTLCLAFRGYALACGIWIVSGFALIIGYLFRNGWQSLSLSLFFGNTPVLKALLLIEPVFDGLFPAMAGTFLLVLLAVGIAIPIGLGTGIYLAEYADSRIKIIFNLIYDVLAGIPSIVVGLSGFMFAVFLHRYVSQRIYPCLLISALSLSFLVLPYLIRTTQLSLENMPMAPRVVGLSLGASKLQNIIHVLIPKALSGIAGGIVLSVGRCAEDTAVIMLTGVAATAGVPSSLLSKYEALPFYIYYVSSQYTGPEELGQGYAACILLLFICCALFGFAYIIKRRLDHFAFYRA